MPTRTTRLSLIQIEKVARLFDLYDRRGNGYLERDDWELLADRVASARHHAPGCAEHEAITRALLAQFERYKAVADFSRDGRIARDEWVDFFELVLGDPVAFEAVVGSTVSLVLSLFDLDEDGTLDREEVARLRRAVGAAAADDPAFFERVDENGDGVVSCTEVRHAIEAFFRSEDRAAAANDFFGPLTGGGPEREASEES